MRVGDTTIRRVWTHVNNNDGLTRKKISKDLDMAKAKVVSALELLVFVGAVLIVRKPNKIVFKVPKFTYFNQTELIK